VPGTLLVLLDLLYLRLSAQASALGTHAIALTPGLTEADKLLNS